MTTAEVARAPARDAGRTRWAMLALAWLLYFAFGLVSVSLVPLITPIRRDLALSYSEIGVVLGAWQFVYMGFAAPAGALIDRIGPKRALVIGALLIALSAAARVFAEGFWTLLLAVGVFGLGGPIISVGLPKLIADWFTGQSRSLASGLYMTGSAAGGVVGLAFTNIALLPLAGSWRGALGAIAVTSLVLALLWWALGRDHPHATAHRRAEKHASKGGTLDVLRDPALWPIILIGFSGFLTGHGLRNWLPQIFETSGFDPATAGLMGALPALTGMAGSIVFLRLAGSGRFSRRAITMALLVVTGATVLAIPFATGPLLIAVIALEGFCAAALTPLMMNKLMETPSIGARHLGVAAGLYFAIGEAGGTLGPALMGVAADLTGTFSVGLFGLAAVAFAMLVPALRLPRTRRGQMI